MGQMSRTFRAALAGMTATLCLGSTLIIGACAVKLDSQDFPAMKLTETPVLNSEPSQ